MAVQIQLRRGTAAEWTAANPVLAEGEIGYETDTGLQKIGNGVDTWTALSYRGNVAAISAGTQSRGSGTIVFSNSNGVSFGMNNGTITASYTTPTQSAQTVGAYAVGNTTGQSSSSTIDARSLSFSGAGNISVGYSGGSVVISATGGGGAADGVNIIAAGTQTANTTGTVAFSNSNGITFGMSNNSVVTASHDGLTSQSNQALSGSNGSFAFQTATFGNLNGLSFYTSNGSMVGSYTVPTQSTQPGIQSLSAGTTRVTTGEVVFSNSNGVSFGVNGATVTASHNGLTTARASNDAVGLNTALTAGPLAWTVNSNGISLNAGSAAGTTSGFAGNLISGSMTHNTAGLNLSLSHPAWLTTAMQSNAATISNIRVSAGTTSNLLSAITFADANGVSFGINGSTITGSHNGLTTARASNDGVGLNTAQSNVTWTVNSAGISLDARGYAGTGTTFNGANISGSITLDSVGLNLSLSAATAAPSPVNISAGTTSNNLATVVFSNSNGVSFGLNGSTVTASVNAGGGGIANAAGTQTATSGTVVFSNSNNITFGMSNSSVITAQAAPRTTLQGWLGPMTNNEMLAGQVGQSSIWVQPMELPHPVAMSYAVLPVQLSNASNSSNSATLSLRFGIYTRNASTLSLLTSGSSSFAFTASGTVGSYSIYGGIRNYYIPITTTLSEGNYWVAIQSQTATGGGAGMTWNQFFGSNINSSHSGRWSVATSTNQQPVLGQGVFSAQSAAFPNGMAFSQVRGTNVTGYRRHIYMLEYFTT